MNVFTNLIYIYTNILSFLTIYQLIIIYKMKKSKKISEK
mgnify:CR=1 FL=1|jgi:hypothetical protein